MKEYYKKLGFHNLSNKIVTYKFSHRLLKTHLLDIIESRYNIFFDKKIFQKENEKTIFQKILLNLSVLRNIGLYDEEIEQLTLFIIKNVKKKLKEKKTGDIVVFNYKDNLGKDIKVKLSFTIIPSTSYNYDDIFIAENYLTDKDQKENIILLKDLIKNERKKGIKIVYYIRWNLIEIVKDTNNWRVFYAWCDTIISDMFNNMI